MAENKKSFVLYTDFINTFEELSDDEAGKLIKHIFRYTNDQNPETDDRLIKIAFEPIKQQLKRDLQKWGVTKTKKSLGGKKGMESRWGKKETENITPDNIVTNDITPITVNDTVTVNVTDTVIKKHRAKALVVAKATAPTTTVDEFKKLVIELNGKDLKTVWAGLKDFIAAKSPPFIEPYYELWNLFAKRYSLAQVEIINDSRKKKFRSRIDEEGFDFIRIMEKIKSSNMLKGVESNWRVTFDWIFENEKNYLKILEGNYDN